MLEDDELIYLAKQGCNYAYNHVYNTYEEYVRMLCKNHYFNYSYIFISSQEVFEMCIWILDDAIKNFCDEKNASFKTYLNTRIKYEILTYVRNEYKQNDLANGGNINLSLLEDSMPLDRLDIRYEKALSDSDNALCKSALELVSKHFDQADISIFKMYLLGYTFAEIQEKTNITKRVALYKIEQIIKLLKETWGLYSN